jgi:transmembrane E3 ubiquitin-protein ligase
MRFVSYHCNSVGYMVIMKLILTIENIAVTFLATTFMAFVLMLYELRFLGLIFRVQRPERPVNRRPPQTILPIRPGNGTPQNTPANTAVNTPAPNTPATATVLPTPEDTPITTPTPTPTPPPQAPVIDEQWEPDNRSEYFIITKYFYVSVLSLFILTSWLSSHRVLMKILLLALHSFWLPQVYRNVMRGVRKALGWRYVFGMTVSRGAMAAWLIWYQKGDWVFFWESDETDIIWGWILLGWLWFQVSILLAQEIFGSRFFISGNVPPSLVLIVVNMCFSYFLLLIIILRRIWMMRNQNLQMGNVMIVRFVCNRLSFRHYLLLVEEVIQLL